MLSPMQAKMGHKAGTGLGKHSQGRVNIVEASKQRGQRGLGHVVKSFEPADVQWDFDKETVSAHACEKMMCVCVCVCV